MSEVESLRGVFRMSNSVESLLRQNLHAIFGERDAQKRRSVIAAIWKEDGVFVDPDGSHRGHAALDEAVEKLLQRFPGFAFTELGPCETFHGIGRLAWGFGPPNEAPAVTGLDVVVTDGDRLNALYTFLDHR
jgi:hypothetical protein